MVEDAIKIKMMVRREFVRSSSLEMILFLRYDWASTAKKHWR